MAKLPKSPRLKVFRTAIGFHDAYVAAPSRAAALRAWGSDKDLFARGAAEEVTDPALSADALAAPGTVVRRSRGTAAEQMAALPPDRPKRAPAASEDAPLVLAKAVAPRKAPPQKPKPSGAALETAEAALASAQARQREAQTSLAEREAALARERRDLERTQASETRRMERDRDDAAAEYDAAMRRWRR